MRLFNGPVTQEASCSCSCTFALKVADTKSWTLPRTKPWETLVHQQRSFMGEKNHRDKRSSSTLQRVYAVCVYVDMLFRDGQPVIQETTGCVLSKYFYTSSPEDVMHFESHLKIVKKDCFRPNLWILCVYEVQQLFCRLPLSWVAIEVCHKHCVLNILVVLSLLEGEKSSNHISNSIVLLKRPYLVEYIFEQNLSVNVNGLVLLQYNTFHNLHDESKCFRDTSFHNWPIQTHLYTGRRCCTARIFDH